LYPFALVMEDGGWKERDLYTVGSLYVSWPGTTQMTSRNTWLMGYEKGRHSSYDLKDQNL